MFENLWQGLADYFYQIIAGFIMLLVGFGLGVLAKRFSRKGLQEIGFNRILRIINVPYNGEEIVSSLLSYIIYLVTIIFFLQQLGITSIVLYLLLGAVLMIIILSFVVGLKDVIPNFIAGLFLRGKNSLHVGMRVQVKEISGKIDKIGHLETEIETEQGDILYVPNNLFLRSKVLVKKKRK